MIDNTVALDTADARRLADAMIRRRVELGYRSARAFSAASGLDARTISALEASRRAHVSRNTLAILEMSLQWDPGYINALIDSGRATRAEQDHGIYLDAGDATEEEIRIARQVAQATFTSTLESLRNGKID